MTPLQQTKQAAIEAKKNLYLPKPLKNVGLELCWQGRIKRAHDLANDAFQKKEADKLKKLTEAIAQIQHEYDEAGIAYDRALKAYQQLGGDPADLDVGECTCPYCQHDKQQEAMFMAESRLRSAVFELTEPDEGGDPLPLALMRQGTEAAQKQAWSLFMDFCNAQANYKRACEQFGRVPSWGYILRAW